MEAFLPLAVQAGFTTLSSRVVGASIRVAKTCYPALKAKGIKNAPLLMNIPAKALKREAMTLGLAWTFTTLTSLFMQHRASRLRWAPAKAAMLTAFCGALLAEGVSQYLHYREERNKPPEAVIPPGSKPLARQRMYRAIRRALSLQKSKETPRLALEA